MRQTHFLDAVREKLVTAPFVRYITNTIQILYKYNTVKVTLCTLQIHYRRRHLSSLMIKSGHVFPAGGLHAHVASAHLGKRYECDLCSKSFTQSGTLAAHKRNHHPKSTWWIVFFLVRSLLRCILMELLWEEALFNEKNTEFISNNRNELELGKKNKAFFSLGPLLVLPIVDCRLAKMFFRPNAVYLCVSLFLRILQAQQTTIIPWRR